MDSAPYLRYLIIGRLSRDFILTPGGKAAIDIPGGSLLYAAAGVGVWEHGIGLVGRVSEDYPQEWGERMTRAGLNVKGLRFLSEAFDMRAFYAYVDGEHCETDNPVSHFARLGLPFPKVLLGYAAPAPRIDSRNTPSLLTVRYNDLPEDYLDASAAHLCPLDFLSHSLLPPALRQGRVTTITLDPAAGYMNPTYWDHLPSIVKGLSAFITDEEKLRSLFLGRSSDLWEMAETIADYGCDVVVVRRGSQGQWLYEKSSHARWQVPEYPARISDPTGAEHAFCGGFLTGYRSTYNGLEGVLTGNISASLASEGTGPFYALDAMPGLARHRLEALRAMVRKV